LSTERSFLDEAQLDWENPAARALREILAAAYPNAKAAQDIVGRVGIREEDVAWDDGARVFWKAVLRLLASRGRLREFVYEHVLTDADIAVKHDRIRELALQPPCDWVGPALADNLLTRLTARIQAEGPAVALDDTEVSQLRSRMPRTEQAYRLRRVADWREPHLAWRGEDLRRFTRLNLLIDQGEDAQMRWSEDKKEYRDLAEVLRAAGANYPVLVLLGEPGAGKTTLLRRLELDLACRGLGWLGARDETGAAAPSRPEEAPLTLLSPPRRVSGPFCGSAGLAAGALEEHVRGQGSQPGHAAPGRSPAQPPSTAALGCAQRDASRRGRRQLCRARRALQRLRAPGYAAGADRAQERALLARRPAA